MVRDREKEGIDSVLCEGFETCRGYNLYQEGWKWLLSEKNKVWIKKVITFRLRGWCPKCKERIGL